GQSSLAQLMRLPLDELKIDKSFGLGLDNAKNEAIVRATIELAHALDLHVAAEGVSEERALRRLSALGCDHAQGFYISPPIAGDQICAWVRGWTACAANAAPALRPA